MVVEFSFSLVETKQLVKTKLNVFVWSPKTDLIALGSNNGCVSVHRYKMTCIWESCLPDLGAVTCLAWRPDGKTLTASYASGAIRFFVVGDGYIFHEIQFPSSIDHLVWTNCITTNKVINLIKNAPAYFPDLKELSMFSSDINFPSSDVCKLSHLLSDTDDNFPILTVYTNHTIYFYGYGIFEIAAHEIHSKKDLDNVKFLNCHLSARLNSIIITESCLNECGEFLIQSYKIPCPGFQKLAYQLRNISSQAYSIKVTKLLLDWSFGQVCISWEDMILEMDAKFTKYARERLNQDKNWSLCVELLEFILFGNCPVALCKFLVEDWTAASLKRTGTATLKAYESIKTICFQQIQFFSQRLLFHVSEVLGMLRDNQIYRDLQMLPTDALNLYRTIAITLRKTQELQLVIEKSIIHLRAFFKWLYAAILGQSGRVLPDDFPRVSSSERELVINFVTNYLQPVFVQDELQSYQVDLVEQYIRSGHVRKPLEVVAQTSLKNDQERASLKKTLEDTIALHKDESLPDGLFQYCCHTTLADLIQKKMEADLRKLFKIPSGTFNRGCLDLKNQSSKVLMRIKQSIPVPVCLSCINNLDNVSKDQSNRLNDSCKFTESSVLMSFTPNSTNHCSNSFVLVELLDNDPSLQFNVGAHVFVDKIPNDSNTGGLPYEIQDMHFYTSQHILLLVNRPKSSRSRTYLPSSSSNDMTKQHSLTRDSSLVSGESMLSWLVMVSVRDVLSSFDSSTINLDSTGALVYSECLSDQNESLKTCLPKKNISDFITTAHVETLPWTAVKLATNGDRSIVFVLFENRATCRVYLIERPETDDTVVVMETGDGENLPSKSETVSNKVN